MGAGASASVLHAVALGLVRRRPCAARQAHGRSRRPLRRTRRDPPKRYVRVGCGQQRRRGMHPVLRMGASSRRVLSALLLQLRRGRISQAAPDLALRSVDQATVTTGNKGATVRFNLRSEDATLSRILFSCRNRLYADSTSLSRPLALTKLLRELSAVTLAPIRQQREPNEHEELGDSTNWQPVQ